MSPKKAAKLTSKQASGLIDTFNKFGPLAKMPTEDGKAEERSEGPRTKKALHVTRPPPPPATTDSSRAEDEVENLVIEDSEAEDDKAVEEQPTQVPSERLMRGTSLIMGEEDVPIPSHPGT